MKIGAVSLALSAVALGVAAYAVTRENPQPQRAALRTDRVATLERQVEELTRELAILKAARRTPIERRMSGSPLERLRPDTGDDEAPPGASEDSKAIEAIVDDAVTRKTKKVIDKLRIKANKKPTIDGFASVLELTDEQRTAAERVIVEGQTRVYQILETPTANGTNLMDELVEVFAKGFVEPGKENGYVAWIGRVIAQKIPGTNETYGARIEAVKNHVKSAFQRNWSEAQYREFQEWEVDPIEIRNVPGSPDAALWKRIVEHARALGADVDVDDNDK